MDKIEICLCGMGECEACSINEQIERWEMEEALREEQECNMEIL